MTKSKSSVWSGAEVYFAAFVAVLTMAATAGSVGAVVITNTSSDFSLGYGWAAPVPPITWKTTEIATGNPPRTYAELTSPSTPPAASNTSTNDGTFSFIPTISDS